MTPERFEEIRAAVMKKREADQQRIDEENNQQLAYERQLAKDAKIVAARFDNVEGFMEDLKKRIEERRAENVAR